jgi:hypothetical protein
MEVILRDALYEVTIQSDHPFTLHVERIDATSRDYANIVRFPGGSSTNPDDYEPNPR